MVTKHTLHYSESFLSMWNKVKLFEDCPLPINTTENMDYISIDSDTNNPTYLTRYRFDIILNNRFSPWDRYARKKYAYNITWERLINRLYPSYGAGTKHFMVEGINSILVSPDTPKLKICIWPSNKIKYAYLCTNYAKPKSGELGSSCMRNSDQQQLLNFYVKNKVRIVVLLTKTDKILGRALLWPNIYFDAWKITADFMDRIFLASDKDRKLFIKLAEEHDFVRGISSRFWYKGKEKRDQTITMPITLEGIKCLPYADTMRYLFVDELILSNSNKLKKSKSKPIHLTTTNRERPEIDPNYVKDILHDGNFIHKKDAIYVDRYNGFIYKKDLIIVGREQYSKTDKDVCQLVTTKWSLRKYCIHSTLAKGYVEKNKVIHISKLSDEVGLCESCYGAGRMSKILKCPVCEGTGYSKDRKIIISEAGVVPDTKKWRDKFVTVLTPGGSILIQYPKDNEKYIKFIGKGKYRLRDKPLIKKRGDPRKVKDPQRYIYDVGSDKWEEFSNIGSSYTIVTDNSNSGYTYYVEKIQK